MRRRDVIDTLDLTDAGNVSDGPLATRGVCDPTLDRTTECGPPTVTSTSTPTAYPEPPAADAASATPQTPQLRTDGGQPSAEESQAQTQTRADPLVAAYRHDLHKMRGRTHANAMETVDDLPVNETVPLGADRDAALLSRPAEQDSYTMANHTSPYRLSLLTGASVRTASTHTEGVRPLIDAEDPDLLHARWLTSSEAALYNEAIHHPYTSLKAHTLLTAALLDAYRADHAFDELWLVVTPTAATESAWPDRVGDSDHGHHPAPGSDATACETEESAATRVDVQTVRESEWVVPHRTVLWTPQFTLRITPTPDGYPAVPLGDAPARSFADTWSRLPTHPLATDQNRRWRVLDAQLRRIRAWSTALQYIEDFLGEYGDPLTDAGEATARSRSARTQSRGERR